MPGFRLTSKARSDLLAIASYTESEWGRQQRNHYLFEIDKTFKKLSKHPTLGKACFYIRTGYRQMPYGQHLVFYTQEASGDILIIRILHKRMDVAPQLI